MSQPMLPSDQYLAHLLGLSNEEYQFFKNEAQRRSKIEPGTPVAGLETLVTLSLVFTLISVGLTIAASFFKPRAKQQGQINLADQDPDNITRNQKFAPRYGFDSIQKPAIIGTTIPVIYTNRTSYSATSNPPRPAGNYGGVRYNLQLIWSQMLSMGGDQFLRSMYLVGEANTASVEGLAIGDNPVGSYDLFDNQVMQDCGKLTVYYRPIGGRIVASDYVWGRAPDTDPGNAIREGGSDVYEVISENRSYAADFCYATKPSTSTRFGLSRWLPNGAAYRLNPTIGPTGQIEKKSRDNGNKFEVEWSDDYIGLANMWKYRYQWSRRCGVVSPSKEYTVGETFQYTLLNSTDANTVIRFDKDNARQNDAEPPAGEGKCTDVANTVASLQNSIDEALVIGELYKFGSALAVLVSRSPVDAVFISDSSNAPVGNGRSITCTFKVVQAGTITQGSNLDPSWSGGDINPPQWMYLTGENLGSMSIPTSWPTVSNGTQGFRCDIANVTLNRAAKSFEIGLRSNVAIKISGFANLKDTYSYKEANDRAGGRLKGKVYPSETTLGLQNTQNGQISMNEERYSFFRIYIRASASDSFTAIPASFAVRSNTGQAVYNYLRFEMSSSKQWELRFEPLSSWELRNGQVESPFIVLDYKVNNLQTIQRSLFGSIWISWTGTTVTNSHNTFKLSSIEPGHSRGLGHSEQDYSIMTDAWGKCAEAFCYDEIQTTVSEGPEHEIVYINTITNNSTKPLYDNLSILGLNIRASQQWSQLSQVSVYVSKGRTVQRLLDNDSFGASNLFPDILRDILLSPVFGLGEFVTPDQIDTTSFVTAAQWCQDRRYFFDGVLAEKVNLRQWSADVAGSMLLELLQRDGKFALVPALSFPEGGPVPISGIFTVGNIVENSFSMEFLAEEDRMPVQASVKWREERLRENYASSGLFPVEREVLVREASTNETDPIESFDLTEYCTNLEHAIDFACYVIRVRRLITHSIKFSTTPDGLDAGLRAGDYIKVALDFTFYDEFANGVILDDGTIVSTRPDLLPTGTHAAVYWDGGDTPVTEGNITVNSSGLGSPTGIVFIKKNVNSQVRTYKIESITLGENGVIDIEAVHHPTDSSGVSEIGKNWTTYTTNAHWVIRTS